MQVLGYKPNAASSGSFFHLPREAGGFSHITVLCKSKSPMERSATCQHRHKERLLISSSNLVAVCSSRKLASGLVLNKIPPSKLLDYLIS